MNRRSLIGLLLLPLLSGCAPHLILRDPSTGQTVNCTVMSQRDSEPGRGLGGAIGSGAARGLIESIEQSRCEQSYKGAGFICIQGCSPARTIPAWTQAAIVLPPDLRVVPPGPQISPEMTTWSGRWSGTLGGVAKHVLVVEEIDGNDAIVVMAFLSPNGPVWRRHRATFELGALKITRPMGIAVYRIQMDGTVLGTLEGNGQIIRAQLTPAAMP